MRPPILVMVATTLLAIESAAAQPPLGQTQSSDANARSIALFREAGKVIQSPRCLNCHPVGDRPTQTDRLEPHRP